MNTIVAAISTALLVAVFILLWEGIPDQRGLLVIGVVATIVVAQRWKSQSQ